MGAYMPPDYIPGDNLHCCPHSRLNEHALRFQH